MCYSYVMGIENEIYTLKALGFKIKRHGKNYKISFPKSKIDIWENFIAQNLQVGYWNEYIVDDVIVFIFHLEKEIKRYEVKDFGNNEVLLLCEKLCGCKFDSIKSMLFSNKFYKRILKNK